MPSVSYGIVVEGPSDAAVYEEFILKICSTDVEIIPRLARGVSDLMKHFPIFFRDLEHIKQGRPVDKALVIRDSGRKDPALVEQEMADRIEGSAFSFLNGIKFHAVRREMETWLLADVEAINSVALSRDGRRVTPVQETLEDIARPKERLMRVLSTAGLPYDFEVCREIARQANTETLRYRCPSFRSFEQKVLDC